jgi:hypothetical protein
LSPEKLPTACLAKRSRLLSPVDAEVGQVRHQPFVGEANFPALWPSRTHLSPELSPTALTSPSSGDSQTPLHLSSPMATGREERRALGTMADHWGEDDQDALIFGPSAPSTKPVRPVGQIGKVERTRGRVFRVLFKSYGGICGCRPEATLMTTPWSSQHGPPHLRPPARPSTAWVPRPPPTR